MDRAAELARVTIPATPDGDGPRAASGRFSTAGFPVGEKRARWEQWTAAALIRLDCLPAHGAEFDADQPTWSCPVSTWRMCVPPRKRCCARVPR
jgi:hypothetical protein